jgi:hypothetical protein
MCTHIFKDLAEYLSSELNIKDFYVSKTQWKLKFVIP